jgi:trimeric autotransporter adhesin
MKTKTKILWPALTLFALACFALLTGARAVVPAPDGGYPGFNTAEGQNALFSLTTGQGNAAAGWFSLWSDTTASFNTGIGAGTLLVNTADFNTATGVAALLSNTTGSLNTANGLQALVNNTTGSGNTALGLQAGVGVTTASNVICIGAGGDNINNSCYIMNIFNQTTASGIPVLVDASNKLGTTTSSKRFKEDIEPMGEESEALFSLKPVTFHYKREIDPTGRSQLGLVAEEVEKVNPDLVVRDKEGKPYTVRYDQIHAMLLNEFLKEHKAFLDEQSKVEQQNRKIQEQKTMIAQLKREIETVIAHAKDQDSKIQRVSEQVEMSRPGPQVIAADR